MYKYLVHRLKFLEGLVNNISLDYRFGYPLIPFRVTLFNNQYFFRLSYSFSIAPNAINVAFCASVIPVTPVMFIRS